MKLFFVLSSILVLASAAPSVLLSPTVYAGHQHVYAVPHSILNQYHAQDELGQYSYGYNGGLSAKTETKSFDGVTRGSYSYVDPDNKLQTVSYTADAIHGFRVAATNLPVAPVDTNVAPVDDGKAPEPVTETPEVAKATAEHLAAVEEVKARNAAAPKEIEIDTPVVAVKSVEFTPIHQTYAQQIIAPIAHYYTPSSFAYSTSEAHYNPVVQTAYAAYHHAPAYGYNFAAPYLARHFSAIPSVEVLKA